jgi:hypothetical protein
MVNKRLTARSADTVSILYPDAIDIQRQRQIPKPEREKKPNKEKNKNQRAFFKPFDFAHDFDKIGNEKWAE